MADERGHGERGSAAHVGSIHVDSRHRLSVRIRQGLPAVSVQSPVGEGQHFLHPFHIALSAHLPEGSLAGGIRNIDEGFQGWRGKGVV